MNMWNEKTPHRSETHTVLNGCREQEGAEQKNKPGTVKTSSLSGEWEQKTERSAHIMILKSCGKLLMCRMVPHFFFSTLALFLGLFEFGHVSIKWNKCKCCYFGSFLSEICFYFGGSRVRAVATLSHSYVYVYFVHQSALSHNHYTVTMPSVILPIIRKVFMFSCA